MNERIKELAEQAGFYVSEDKIYIPTTSEDITACQTKFAELIIKECVNACEENSWMMLDAYRRSSQIKQHFGVKE